MTILLAGDIGATKTILRLVKSEPQKSIRQLPEQTNLYEQIYPSQEFPDLVPMVHKFLIGAQQEIGGKLAPEKACFGIAGPVVNNTCKLTNLSWVLETGRLKQELQIPVRIVLNRKVGLIGAALCADQLTYS